MIDSVNVRNPTGIKFTQEQIDESFRERYWMFATRYGLQYYVSGRFATANRFTPVCANLLHHAVELLLKACLSYDDPLDMILKYGDWKKGYGHNILLLWTAFKERRPAAVPAEFDAIIEALHEFEDIRYPENLIRNGARISIGLFVVEEPIQSNDQMLEPSYVLMLPQIDRLVGLLFEASHANPEVFLREITDEQGLKYYEIVKTTLFGRPAPGALPTSVRQSQEMIGDGNLRGSARKERGSEDGVA